MYKRKVKNGYSEAEGGSEQNTIAGKRGLE
jgi:hypothetical protein